ncbi:MAG: excinuclease ABC subunit UvrC [bacterium]
MHGRWYTVAMLTVEQQRKRLPEKPGVYIYHDLRDTVLYVGKAKNLKKRVASYFQQTDVLEPSKQLMVKKIARIDFIMTDTEIEALLLEATLIKKYHPPYNIILRDDKDFLYIRVALEEEYPTVVATRRVAARGSRYFGPYTSAAAARATVRLLKRVFAFRTCMPHRVKPCFDMHLGRCLGPCADAITPAAYRRRVVQPILGFLAGRSEEVIRRLRTQMQAEAKRKNFEQAARIRDRLFAIEKTTERQKMIAPRRDQFDVASITRDRDWAVVNLFQIREGKVLHKQDVLLEQPPETPDAEILDAFFSQFYALAADRPKVVIVRELPKNAKTIKRLLGITLSAPRRGRKRQLVVLGEVNAREYLERRKDEWLSDVERSRKALEGLTKALALPLVPRRIEAFDISNIQGTHAVGSMVVFENGQPKKSDFRKFTVRLKQRPNDVAMMAEIVRRRLQRSDWPRPDLILLDGGKGQLAAVLRVLKDAKEPPAVVALAKREEELFLPHHAEPILLPRASAELFLIQRIRDEAHRFAITFFRGKHQKSVARSLLDDVPGIGPATKRLLLRRFGSLVHIRQASDNELAKLIGKKRTEQLRDAGG